MIVTDSDWPEDPNPLTPEVEGGLKEFADRVPDSDERQKLIHAALSETIEQTWIVRRARFLKDLDTDEARWFGSNLPAYLLNGH